MNNFEAIIDVGSKNLKLGIFNSEDKSIYSSEQKINDNGSLLVNFSKT